MASARFAVVAFVLLLATGNPAAQRKWLPGTWRDSPDARSYVLSTDTFRLHLEDLTPSEQRALPVAAGTAVKFVVEGNRVVVLDAAAKEHELKLVRRVDLVYAAPGAGHYLKAVGEGGASVTLEDGSTWEIDPRAHVFTARWQALEGISVRAIEPENGFTYEINNTDQDVTTLARFNPR